MQLFLADCQFPDIENQVKLINYLWKPGKMVKWQTQIKQTNLKCYSEYMLQEKEESFVYVRRIVIRRFLSILPHGELNLASIWNLHL